MDSRKREAGQADGETQRIAGSPGLEQDNVDARLGQPPRRRRAAGPAAYDDDFGVIGQVQKRIALSKVAAVERRSFGSTDLRVSAFGLGCARIGGIFQRDPEDFVNLLSAAYDHGINFYDTADIYSQGESEALVGKAFRGRRDRIVIASKAGYVLPAQRRFVARIKPIVRPLISWLGLRRQQLPGAVRGTPTQDFSAAHLRQALEGSLRRLRTEYLDLFQLHSPPVDVIERGNWLEPLERLKREGKIRYYGISCDSLEAATAALRYRGPSSLQIVINLLEQQAVAVLPSAQRSKIAIIARECLANGLLVKKASDVDLKSYCQTDGEIARKSEQLAAYRRQAAGTSRSLARMALDFVSQLEGVSVALVGVSRQRQLATLFADRD
jgi:aryl-alcohol dehydrogenase-like predicted oxidoreductase